MQSKLFLRAFIVIIGLSFAMAHAGYAPVGQVFADDDDGGDDDDSGGASSGSSASGGGSDRVEIRTKKRISRAKQRGRDAKTQRGGNKNKARSKRQQSAVVKAQPAAPLPGFAAREIVTLSLTDTDLAILLARGYSVLEQREMFQFGFISRRLAVPKGTTMEEARAEVRGLASGGDADFNHFYRSQQAIAPAVCKGPHCASFEQIGWRVSSTIGCNAKMAVGVIDTGINPDHPTFAAARLEVHKLTPGNLDPSRAIHGTAVTALLIGDPEGRSPGLLPGARVVAVDAFHVDGQDERADVFTLVAAMELLVAKDIRVVNLSLAGPPNAVLERAVASAVDLDVILVAATGNEGPNSAPVYPAAYQDVVAVTAIDSAGTVYRRAGRGAHVDLAAPGVQIWTAASVNGAKPKTGTSFAAPFVSAAAATYLAADPQLSAKSVVGLMTTKSIDLGAPGYDDVYGHGLVQAGPSCEGNGFAAKP